MGPNNTNRKSKEESTLPEAPEGGWGWFVALGYALSLMSATSFISCFGFVFEDFFDKLGYGTKGLSFTYNVFLAMYYFAGTVLDLLIRRFSCRHVAIAGSLLYFTGYFLTTFANSMIHIAITYGVMCGTGLGLLIPSGFTTLSNYFVRRRVTVMGICQFGIGLANIGGPMAAEILLDHYGFRPAVALIAAFSLHTLVGASLYRPVTRHKKTLKISEQDEPLVLHLDKKIEIMPISATSKQSQQTSDITQTVINNKYLSTITSKKSLWLKIVKTFDLDFLKDFNYVSAVLGLAVAFMAEVNFQTIYPLHASSIGFDKSKTAMGLTAYLGADLFSRLVFPIMTNRFKLTNRTVFLFATVAGVISKITLMQVRSYYPAVLAVTAFCGFFRSPVLINPPLVIAEICPLDRLPGALGLNMVISGIVTIALGPILGLIRDVSESYPTCIYSLCAMALIAPILRGVEYIVTTCKKERSKSPI